MSETDELMARAREFLATGRTVLRRGDYNTAANRAYFAMFLATMRSC